MACEHIKIVTFSEGTYAISAEEPSPPCRYTVRWCPKVGHVMILIQGARADRALRAVREHRILGDTVDHLMAFSLDETREG